MPTIISSFPNYSRHIAGATVSIRIEYFGFPNPTLVWYRRGGLVVNNSLSANFSITENSSILTFANIYLIGQEIYVANASNVNGFALKQFVLDCEYFGNHC